MRFNYFLLSGLLLMNVLPVMHAERKPDTPSPKVSLHKVKFYGIIEKLPGGDLTGKWIVSKNVVTVNKSTHIENAHGQVEPGAHVKVYAYLVNNEMVAYEIEVKQTKNHQQDD